MRCPRSCNANDWWQGNLKEGIEGTRRILQHNADRDPYLSVFNFSEHIPTAVVQSMLSAMLVIVSQESADGSGFAPRCQDAVSCAHLHCVRRCRYRLRQFGSRNE